MALTCGIDLGTTYSAISFYDKDNDRVDTIDLETADGANILPSVVFYPADGEPPVVGISAVNSRRQFPERVIVGIKRSMGTDFKTMAIDDREYSPEEVSADILMALAKDAAPWLGQPATDVVITVPAYFGDNERAATEEAGRLAGLNVLSLLPEPHAAALAFAVQKAHEMADRYILVYDLGGGTFDITLIHSTLDTSSPQARLHIDTLCKDGNIGLGGLDWDRNLAEIVAEKMLREHDIDLWEDPRNEAILLDNCEKAKRHLSRAANVQVTVGPHAVTVSRVEFEDRTASLLLETETLLDHVLEDATTTQNIPMERIEILLAGGSTFMPMVREMVTRKMGREPIMHRNPNLLVTIGAAYWAHLLTEGEVNIIETTDDGGREKRPMVVSQPEDISTYAVGIEVVRPDSKGGWKGYNAVILEPQTKYGADPIEREFGTSEDNMTEIRIALYKGESEKLDECDPLVVFTLSGLPPNLPAGSRIKVQLGYDYNGILRGKALVVNTGQSVDIVYDRTKA
jgi:molecular chaperone DnaK